MSVFMSVIGLFVMLAIGFLASANRKRIKWKTVLMALACQLAIGSFVMYVPIGAQLLTSMSDSVQSVITNGNQGLAFVFGDLSNFSVGFIFAINVMCLSIFVTALISLLYYLGIMGKVINLIGGVVHRIIGVSKSEAACASANVFVGPAESAAVSRPFLNTMTKSELFTVVTCGLTAVAGSSMAGYIALGIDPRYILTAAFMTAPAGLLFSKLLFPETEKPKDISEVLDNQEDKPKSALDAISKGALIGMRQAAVVCALLIAFVGLIAMANSIVGSIAEWFGYSDVSIEMLIGYVLAPLAFLMGVPWGESVQVGSLIGQKFIVNEFVAYMSLTEITDTLSPKSLAISTFALLGYANIATLSMVLGSVTAMAPKREADLNSIGPRALLAALLANLTSGVIAGLLVSFGAVI